MRNFSNQDYEALKVKMESFKADYGNRLKQDHITIGHPGDKESINYANQISEKLRADGYKLKEMTLLTFGNNQTNVSISNAPDDSILVEIFSEK